METHVGRTYPDEDGHEKSTKLSVRDAVGQELVNEVLDLGGFQLLAVPFLLDQIGNADEAHVLLGGHLEVVEIVQPFRRLMIRIGLWPLFIPAGKQLSIFLRWQEFCKVVVV